MVIDKVIPALINGVSQQPDAVRLPSQCSEMINCLPTVVDGLRRRPPTEYIARLTTGSLSGAYLHTIARDASEEYTVVMTDGNLRVFDMAGVEKTVTFPGRLPWAASTVYSVVGHTMRPTVANGFLYRVATAGTSGASEPTWPTTLGATVVSGTIDFQCVPDYLNVDSPKADFAAVTVADFTFIVNKTVRCAMGAAGYDTVTAPAAQFSITASKIKKGAISQLVASAEQQAVRDQYAPNGAQSFKGTRQSIADIPTSPAPVDGDLWEIVGAEGVGFTRYYVRRSGGVWDETVGPNLANRVLECTLPHALVRLADGTFEFQTFSWAARRVGDDTTNPNPSFIGRTIKDVFFYQDRLGFAIDEGVSLSRTGDYGNFYRTTVLDLLDDDPVSVNASQTDVTLINHAVAFDRGLMLFADKAQFRAKHGEVLKKGSLGLDPATSYNMVGTVRPCAIGSDVYFVSEDGTNARVWEYFVREDSISSDASDVTGHVPKYIPAGVSRLVGSSDNDLMLVLTDGLAYGLYCYKFYWANETDKAQSAWGKWTFSSDSTVLSAAILGRYVYFVQQRADGAYLERMSLEPSAVAAPLSIQLYMDRRVSVTGTYLSGEGKTQWVLPYEVASAQRADFRIVRGSTFSGQAGAVVSVSSSSYEWVNATTVKVVGNFSGGACFAGLRYRSEWTPSKQVMKDARDQPINTGRLILGSYTFSFKDTAYFRTEVAPYGVSPEIEEIIPALDAEFTGKVVGEAQLVLGTPVFTSGSYTATVGGEASVAVVSVVNDTCYGSVLTSASWSGIYHNKARTI